MALSNEDKADVKGAMGKAIANKVARVTRDKGSATDRYGNTISANLLTGAEKDVLRKKYGTNRLTGSMMDEGRRAKSKALQGKRYQPAEMPKNFFNMTQSEKVDYYNKNKGKMVSDAVNPKTGKYFNTK